MTLEADLWSPCGHTHTHYINFLVSGGLFSHKNKLRHGSRPPLGPLSHQLLSLAWHVLAVSCDITGTSPQEASSSTPVDSS